MTSDHLSHALVPLFSPGLTLLDSFKKNLIISLNLHIWHLAQFAHFSAHLCPSFLFPCSSKRTVCRICI